MLTSCPAARAIPCAQRMMSARVGENQKRSSASRVTIASVMMTPSGSRKNPYLHPVDIEIEEVPAEEIVRQLGRVGSGDLGLSLDGDVPQSDSLGECPVCGVGIVAVVHGHVDVVRMVITPRAGRFRAREERRPANIATDRDVTAAGDVEPDVLHHLESPWSRLVTAVSRRSGRSRPWPSSATLEWLRRRSG